MTNYYECHITIEALESERVGVVEKVEEIGWKFSSISGDPILGAGTKMYATKHYPGDTEFSLILDAINVAAFRLRERGLRVIREKIEAVRYDTARATA